MSKKTLDREKWARRDAVYLEEGVMILLDAEPFDVDSHIWPKPEGFDDIYETAIRSIDAGTLQATKVVWQSPRTLAKHHVPRWQYRWTVSLRDLLAWAREKKYPIPQGLEEAVNQFHPEPKDRPQGDAELAGIESPRPAGETELRTSIAPDNEPIAKRRAPDKFVVAVISLIAEISKRAAEKGMPFNPTEMPGTKADLRAVAIKFDSELDKGQRTFDDYLVGLVRFNRGARKTPFYRELFPEYFEP